MTMEDVSKLKTVLYVHSQVLKSRVDCRYSVPALEPQLPGRAFRAFGHISNRSSAQDNHMCARSAAETCLERNQLLTHGSKPRIS